MKLNTSLIYLLLLLLSITTGISQELSTLPADNHILQLKNGILLVKLNTQSRRINARIEAGKTDKAEKLQKEVEKEHQEIMDAFQEHYNFSDYYFFYSDDSDKVIVDKDYSVLFKGNDDTASVPDSLSKEYIYLMILGTPPGYPSVDKYHFLLSYLSMDGRQYISKPMPRSFNTRSKKWFKNDYDFNRSVERMNERFEKFLAN